MADRKIVPTRSPGGPPAADAGDARAEASRREEWLLDEALEETFPASDPISPALPTERQDTKKRRSGRIRGDS
jgi:hypothetical protein